MGFVTRVAAVIMIINMVVAIATTKVPILVNDGFWTMAHESRTDYAMLLGSIFLLLVGGGRWSVDALLRPPKTGPQRAHDRFVVSGSGYPVAAERRSQKSSKRPLNLQQRSAMIASAPATVQCIPARLQRTPITVLQPASTTPDPTQRP